MPIIYTLAKILVPGGCEPLVLYRKILSIDTHKYRNAAKREIKAMFREKREDVLKSWLQEGINTKTDDICMQSMG